MYTQEVGMRITKPEDSQINETGDTTNTEPMISVDYLDEPLPITEYVKNRDGLIEDILDEPSAFGLVAQQHVRELESQLEHQQEKIGQLEEFIEILAAASSASIYGECSACGAKLEQKKPLFQTDHIACSECGNIVAGLE